MGLTATQTDFRMMLTRNVVYVYFFYGVLASPAPSTFVCLSHAISSDRSPISPLLLAPDGLDLNDDALDIVLTGEEAPGSMGIVHTGTLQLSVDGPRLPVVVKLAFSSYEKHILDHENQIYEQLQSKGVKGIPQCFGLFKHLELVGGTEGPDALIMLSVGQSMSRSTSHV